MEFHGSKGIGFAFPASALTALKFHALWHSRGAKHLFATLLNG